ncbi:MAG: CapA family protein [Turicibacter sp.]|nr:CapA family protein [Turicibacter sp.]
MMKKLKTIKWRNVVLFLFVMVGLLVLAQSFVLPDMVGWDVDRVKHYEAANDIDIKYNNVYSDTVPYGTVTNQERCEKTEECDVILTFSKGKDVSSKSDIEIETYLNQLIEEERLKSNDIIYNEPTYSTEVNSGYAIVYDANPYEGVIEITFSLGPEIHVYEATMVAVGDILLHDTVYNDFRLEGDTFDFSPLFEAIKKYIEPADFAFANQETNIGGTEVGLSSYPNFNSPYEIARDLISTGFNMFARSNNHTLDKGEAGVIAAQKNWETFEGIITAGSTDSQEKRDQIPVIDKNDIKIALLSYSYGFNGYQVPEDKPYLANEFDYNQATIDIEKAKSVSDVIVVSMHWGIEYSNVLSEAQLEQAQWLSDQGVHVILGTHPHVLQPMARLTGKDGNETLVAYSLGNFISGQVGLERLVGGIMKFDIKKTTIGDDVQIEISQPQFMPTYNYAENSASDYKLVPLVDSSQAEYFEAIKSLMENYSQKVDVVDYITYNELEE